jgi:hypothetical protein
MKLNCIQLRRQPLLTFEVDTMIHYMGSEVLTALDD